MEVNPNPQINRVLIYKMAKKCMPGFFCIGNMTLFVCFFLFLIVIYYLHSNLLSKTPVSSSTNTKVVVISQPSSDVLSNPYNPPLQNPLLNQMRMRTREPYSQIGILTRQNGIEMILPLMGRRIQRDKWNYYTLSNSGNVNTRLPIKLKNKSCTSEYGCDEVYTGDEVYVEGYKDVFLATIYENGVFRYEENI